MQNQNKVFIATSLDGYIADRNGGLGFLDTYPEINSIDTGYNDHMASIDALVMGRVSFETVVGFDIPWPYDKPVYVLSNTLDQVPEKCGDQLTILNGSIPDILEKIHSNGHTQLYIDGGKVIQSFLKHDLIDEMIITIIPVLLGGGIPLFSESDASLNFECFKTQLFLDKIVQNHYRKVEKA